MQVVAETYESEVVTFTADIGQGEEVEPRELRRNPWALSVFLLRI